MKYKNFLFDLDGTLTDPYMGITTSILHSLTYYPHITPPTREELKPFIGPPLYASYMKYFDMDEKTANEAVAHYREYYSVKGKFENELYEGIKELLCELKKRGAKIIMATSKPKVFAKDIAEHFGISEYFDYICGSGLDGHLVDKDELIAHLMEVTPLKESESVMIGDTLFDVMGAEKNGMDSIAVTYGYGVEKELRQSSAVAVADTVEELARLLLCD